MSLCIFDLSNELKNCGPEARFLLEAMVLLAQGGSAGEVAVSAQLLAKQLRLAGKLVRDALVELTGAQLVVVHEGSSGRRGRPAIRYELASSVLSALPKREGAYGVHADLLVRLFSVGGIKMGKAATPAEKEPRVQKDGRKAPSGAAGYLSACNRLLLATLLAHADPLGMVKSVSRDRLCQLTGLDEFSLKHRLRRLKSLGLILARIPGLSSKLFPGTRVNSTYFLNVTHPRLGGGSGAVWCGTFDPEISSPTRDQVLRPDLGRKFGAKDHPVRCFLRREEAAFDILRPMVLRYASYLLSHHRDKVDSGSPIDCQLLREKISADFQRPAGWKAGEVSFDHDWAQVVDHFYQLAFRVAQDFRQVIDIDYRFDEVCLVPFDGGLQYILWLNVVEGHEGDPWAGS